MNHRSFRQPKMRWFYLPLMISLLAASAGGCGIFESASAESGEPAMIVLPEDTGDAKENVSAEPSSSGSPERPETTAVSEDSFPALQADSSAALLTDSPDLSAVAADGARNGIVLSAQEQKTEKNNEAGDLILSAAYCVPTVEISGNPAAGAAISSSLAERTQELETNLEILSAEAESMSLTAEDAAPFQPYEVQEQLLPARLDASCISIMDESYIYVGGTYGSTTCYGYNFDTLTGNILTLSSIASDTEALKNSLSEAALEACSGGRETYDLFDDYETSLSSVIRDGSWIFTEDGIVLIVPETLIAPHSSGILYIQIPWQRIDGLKEAYSL